LGEGLLWTEPPVDFCNETRRTSTSTRSPSAPASDRRPLAEPPNPWRLLTSHVDRPKTTCACAVRDAPPVHDPRRVRLQPPRPRFRVNEAKMHTWTSHPEAKGPQPFGLLAGLPPSKAAEHPSVVNPLPRRTKTPPPRLAWSVTPGFPGGEGPRLATRADRDLRSDAYPRRSTLSRRPGCFPPAVAARVGGSPLVRAVRSLRHAARPCSGEGIAVGRPAPLLLRTERLALTSQASRSSSRGGVRGFVLVGRLSQRPVGFYDAYSLAD
jgi:hypothetical protein